MVNAIHYQVHYTSRTLSHMYLDTRSKTGSGSRLKLCMAGCYCTTSNNYARVIWREDRREQDSRSVSSWYPRHPVLAERTSPSGINSNATYFHSCLH